MPAARAPRRRRRVKVTVSSTPPGSTEAHTRLVNECRLWISDHKGLPIQNNTGALFTGHGTMLSYGLRGSSDIIACWRTRFLAVECKTGNAKLGEQQEKFRKAVLRAGGLHILARSTRDLERLLDENPPPTPEPEGLDLFAFANNGLAEDQRTKKQVR
jgi:hypothetical protein